MSEKAVNETTDEATEYMGEDIVQDGDDDDDDDGGDGTGFVNIRFHRSIFYVLQQLTHVCTELS